MAVTDEIDTMVDRIDALVDWELTESPAARVEHAPHPMRCMVVSWGGDLKATLQRPR